VDKTVSNESLNIQHNIDQNDAQTLFNMISRHVHYTNSARGKEILDNWDVSLTKFIKVMPVDYKRALAERKTESKTEETTHG